jgi:hypothetical protein
MLERFKRCHSMIVSAFRRVEVRIQRELVRGVGWLRYS